MFPDPDYAVGVATSFKRDRWLWFKVLAWAVIGWLSLLPHALKVLILLVSGVIGMFLVPGPAGRGVDGYGYSVVMMGHGSLLWLWFLISAYGIGCVSLPGLTPKAIGVAVLFIVTPLLILLAGLVVGLVSVGLIGIEQFDLVTLYLDGWMPVEFWKAWPMAQ